MKKRNILKALKNTVVVVSGLPRSGTSLMMQMLQAGGIEILADSKREPDANNPRGYLELEAVKSLDKDNSCLKDAPGKAVKIISHLLKHLPGEYEYKVILMRRNMKEIIKSQQKMLHKDENETPEGVVKYFEQELKNVISWAESSPNVKALNLNYKDVLNNSAEEIQKINKFLGIKLDAEKMAEIIDPTLYRNRAQ